MVQRRGARAVARTVPDGDEMIWAPALAAGARGLAWVAGFWLVVGGLLAARYALFDAIGSARLAGHLANQLTLLPGLGG